jgi:hypothetical protein
MYSTLPPIHLSSFVAASSLSKNSFVVNSREFVKASSKADRFAL